MVYNVRRNILKENEIKIYAICEMCSGGQKAIVCFYITHRRWYSTLMTEIGHFDRRFALNEWDRQVCKRWTQNICLAPR